MVISKPLKKLIASGVIAAALIGSLVLVPLIVARADTPAPAAVATAQPAQPDPTRLQNQFAAEQKLQTTQSQRLDGASKVISTTQQFIDRQNGLGKDTDGLVQLLNAYKATVENARDLHQRAQGFLDAHAGFEANGVETDAAAARTTVTNAGRTQREFYLTMNLAAFDLRRRIQLWRLYHL
jgi:hypothetical protein